MATARNSRAMKKAQRDGHRCQYCGERFPMVKKPTPRPTVTTSSYERTIEVLTAGKDVVLAADEVRVRPSDLLHAVCRMLGVTNQ